MEYYSLVLTFHVMAMMSWMAMLFYLPRIFVYHTEHRNKPDYVEVAKIQELKIYKLIGVPALWATVISGGVMLYLNPYLLAPEAGGWMHAKLLAVFFLIIYSYSLESYRKKLEREEYTRSGNFFRAYNEVPTILSLLIVAYVITKTFSLLFTIITLLFGAFIIYKVLKQTPKDAK